MSLDSFDWADEVEEELEILQPNQKTTEKTENKVNVKTEKNNTLSGSKWSTIEIKDTINLPKKTTKKSKEPVKKDSDAVKLSRQETNVKKVENDNDGTNQIKPSKKNNTIKGGLESSKWASTVYDPVDSLTSRLEEVQIKEEITATLEWKDYPEKLDVLSIMDLFKAYRGNKGIKLRYINDSTITLNFESLKLAEEALRYYRSRKLGGTLSYYDKQDTNNGNAEEDIIEASKVTRIKPKADCGPAKRMIAHSLGVSLSRNNK
ncbi:hypothetical protein K502DRAFT_368558 [Neoconidiobolus thromboides FSU 785]|nr:hypothetical protein K502DRAFT_368558 [Neoconidiobolus thromboides FSU 785]